MPPPVACRGYVSWSSCCEIRHDCATLQFVDEEAVIPFRDLLRHAGLNCSGGNRDSRPQESDIATRAGLPPLARHSCSRVTGWSNLELKTLPERAVEHLAMAISSSLDDTFPSTALRLRSMS